MDNTSLSEGYLNVNDVAVYLKTKSSWIYQNHKRLGIPSYSLGRKLLFKRSEIDTWLTSQ